MGAASRIASFYSQVDAFERELIARALEQSHGNERAAARSLGLSLVALQLKCERLGLTLRVRLRAEDPT